MSMLKGKKRQKAWLGEASGNLSGALWGEIGRDEWLASITAGHVSVVGTVWRQDEVLHSTDGAILRDPAVWSWEAQAKVGGRVHGAHTLGGAVRDDPHDEEGAASWRAMEECEAAMQKLLAQGLAGKATRRL